MANLKETTQWEEGIYQIETSDPVMGGENGIDNKPLRQLANRTAYLKQALETAEQNNTTALNGKAAATHSHAIADITNLQAALNGKLGTRGLLNETDLDTLHGSQNIGIWAQNIANRATLERHYPVANKAGTLLVLPSAYAGQQVYLPMGESVLYRRHATDNQGTWGAWESIGGQAASLTRAGLVQLSSATDSDLETTAATSKAVKTAFDRAVAAEGKGLPIGAVVAFPRAVSNPTGHLKADGATFDAATYPDLYKALGNNNKLPDLTRSDVGMTAYFAADDIPAGWLAFDDIAVQVTPSTYPELHALLIKQYGSVDAVPKAADRFIRNASGGLTIGQTQEDDIKSHKHRLPNIVSDATRTDLAKFFADPIADPTMRYVLAEDGGLSDNMWATPISPHMATGGDETRPKSLILNLCIKAKNSLDDVQFWVKAYGSVANAGSLDAAALSADVQHLRLRIEREERARESGDRTLHQAIEQIPPAATRQTIGGCDIVRLVDGTMIQTTRVSIGQLTGNETAAKSLTWGLAFAEPPVVTATVAGESWTTADVWVTLDAVGSTAAVQKYWLWEAALNKQPLTLHFTAIGRWK